MRRLAGPLATIALLFNAAALPWAVVAVVAVLFAPPGYAKGSMLLAAVACGANVVLFTSSTERRQVPPLLRRGALALNVVVLIGLANEQGPSIFERGAALPVFFPWGPALLAIPAYASGVAPNPYRARTIVGGLGVFAAWSIWINSRWLGIACTEGPRMRAAVTIKQIETALREFESATGRVPTSEEGLQPLVTDCDDRGPGCLLPKIPIDPWGNPFLYENDGGQITITCFGADGQPGGTELDADITNLGLR